MRYLGSKNDVIFEKIFGQHPEDRNRVAITQHIGINFKEGELDKNRVCKDFLQTTQHGAVKGKTQTTKTKYYNLDVIISVGYRVKSKQGTQFRQWATQGLKDYLVKGYAINEKRLEQKQQEVLHLKTGIQILSRAIEAQNESKDNEILSIFAKGLEAKRHLRFASAKAFSEHSKTSATRGCLLFLFAKSSIY